MGQKVNPIGFRVGVSRKWSFSWFSPSNVQKSNDSAQVKNTLLSKGVVSSRGGFFLSSFEEIFRGFFKRYVYYTFSKSRRFLPIDVQCIKGANQHLFVFLTYIKLRGRKLKKLKRKKAIKIKKTKRFNPSLRKWITKPKKRRTFTKKIGITFNRNKNKLSLSKEYVKFNSESYGRHAHSNKY